MMSPKRLSKFCSGVLECVYWEILEFADWEKLAEVFSFEVFSFETFPFEVFLFKVFPFEVFPTTMPQATKGQMALPSYDIA